MAKVDVAVRIKAPPDKVWAVLSDHERMSEWTSLVRRVRLLAEGSPDRNGKGALRLMEAPGQSIEEEIVAWDPPRSYEYALRKGAPVRNHHGRLGVTPQSDGCEVRWTVEFDPAIPLTGTAMALGLRLGFAKMLQGLKQFCESR